MYYISVLFLFEKQYLTKNVSNAVQFNTFLRKLFTSAKNRHMASCPMSFLKSLKQGLSFPSSSNKKLNFKTTFLLSYMAYNVARLHISERPLIIVVLEKVC